MYFARRSLAFLATLSLLLLTAMAPQSARPDQESANGPDPSFENALARWLQDDDRQSLPKLADMASKGSEPARRFLHLLSLRPDLWTPWLTGLSDGERDIFFKPELPGGPAHGGWWKRGEAPEPVSLLRSKPLEEPFVADMIRLIEAGEPRLAFTRLAGALQYKPLAETVSLGDHPSLPPELTFFEDLSGFIQAGRLPEEDAYGPEPDTPAEERMQQSLYLSWAMFLMVRGDYGHEIPTETMREVITVLHRIASDLPYITAEVTLADPETSGKSAWPDRRRRTLDWLKQSPAASHYRTMCAERCGDGADRCLLTAFFANGGYAVMYGKQTPSEQLIPAVDFTASPRGRMLPIRRVARETLALGRDAGSYMAELRKGSACYLKQVAGEMRRLEKGE